MNRLRQWIYNALLISFLAFQLTGCSGDSEGDEIILYEKTSAQTELENWIKKQVTAESTQNSSTKLNNFIGRIVGDDEGQELPLIEKSYTDILPNITKDVKSLDDKKGLMTYLSKVKTSLKNGSFAQDTNIKNIVEKVTQAFIDEYGDFFTEETTKRITYKRYNFMRELNTYVINAMYESLEKDTPFLFN